MPEAGGGGSGGSGSSAVPEWDVAAARAYSDSENTTTTTTYNGINIDLAGGLDLGPAGRPAYTGTGSLSGSGAHYNPGTHYGGYYFGPIGSFFGTLFAGFAGIGKVATYPFRLIPGTSGFWANRDANLQDLYDRSNIGGTGWQTMSEVGSYGAANALLAGILAPSKPVLNQNLPSAGLQAYRDFCDPARGVVRPPDFWAPPPWNPW